MTRKTVRLALLAALVAIVAAVLTHRAAAQTQNVVSMSVTPVDAEHTRIVLKVADRGSVIEVTYEVRSATLSYADGELTINAAGPGTSTYNGQAHPIDTLRLTFRSLPGGGFSGSMQQGRFKPR